MNPAWRHGAEVARTVAIVTFAIVTFVVGLAARPTGGSAAAVYVDGRKTANVVYVGPEWTHAREWVEGSGAGLFARDGIGRGNFQVEVGAALSGLGASHAAIVLGDSRFELDGEEVKLLGSGPLFGGQSIALGDARAFFTEGKRFDCTLRRSGTTLSITINGKSVAQLAVDDRAVGRVGIVPEKATVRLFRFALQGELVPPAFDPADEALRGPVDAAVQRGVDWLLSKQMRDGSWRHMQYGFVPGQTALCAYTLMRAGLTPDHPALVRAFAYLESSVPSETYTAGVMAMAYEACADPARVPRIQTCLAKILDWEQHGQWGYPLAHENDFAHWLTYNSPTDLSNTQYAALGMRAAQHAGLEVPDKVWIQMLQTTLALQEDARDVAAPSEGDKTAPSGIPIAGFRYQKEREVSTSMTEAGVGVLKMCRDALGPRLRGKDASDSQRAIQLGVAWLDHEFNLDDHVGGSKVWQFYSIYGLERVGTLLGTGDLGHHAWYAEGAKWLLAKQNKEGSWSVPATFKLEPWHKNQDEADTCFAILFLKRASRPTVRTGNPREKEPAAIDESQSVWLRASGSTTVTFWIAGFAPDVVARNGSGTPSALHVESIEYTSDGQVIGNVTCDPSVPWTESMGTVQHTFEHAGKHAVVARVTVRTASGTEVLESKPIEARSDGEVRPWMLAAATARTRNLLAGAHATASASSEPSADESASKACDGAAWTRWSCSATDTDPWIVLEMPKAVTCDKLVLSGACLCPDELGRFDRIEQVSVRVNRDKEPTLVDVAPDELEPTVYAFERTVAVSRLEIRVTKRSPGGAAKNQAGFAEIALEKRER